jgi:hypothetical protein
MAEAGCPFQAGSRSIRMDNEGAEQDALFYIEGPDEDGCVWIYGASTSDPWAQNLGPVDKVAEVLSQWLGEIASEDRRLSRRDRMKAWDADLARLDNQQMASKDPIDVDEVDKRR